ncbi:MAG TPA: TonB-dependent receptor [Gillisia sp.]|nr:TonB-dependent receptor [Gillisia sp.]
MKKRLNGILTLLLVLVVQLTFAQEKTVTGTVVDENGVPLPAVNVIVQGTSRGTLTNFDGEYSINASQGETLVFSYVGYISGTFLVGDASRIDVTLGEDAAQLDEVVVVAYGTQTKRSIVGSVVSLGEETLEKQQLTTVTQALQGNVPGVNILTSGGQPGNNPTIRIRGVASINASADPLIIVDGAPFNGNINSISGDQIESMNVLKDASSTALYGSRAANGVIVITTKRGGFNQAPKVTLTTSSGLSSPAVDLHETMGAEQFMRYAWEARRNTSQYVTGQNAETAGQSAASGLIGMLGYNPYDTANPIDATGNVVSGANLLWDTDWADAMLNNAALRTEHGVNVSGGGADTRYFLSANYLNQEGSVKTSDFERITTRLNIESNVTDWLQVGLNSGLSTSGQNQPTQDGNSFQSSIQWIYSMSNIYPLYRRDGQGALVTDASGNPIYDYGATSGQTINGARPLLNNENAVGSLYNYDSKNNRTNVNANGFAKLKFTDYLSFRTNLSYENYLLDTYSYASNEVGYAANVGGRVSQDRNITTTLNFINSLNFDKTFGAHGVQADLIYESYALKIDALGAQGTGFLPGVKVLNGSTLPEGVSGYINEERLISYLGRVAYNYDNKYFIEGSYRRDGSTRFSPDTRWGDFYAVGASWVISDEAFLRDSRTLSFLKLKSSYGELGNNQGIGYFPYLQLFDTGWNELDNTGVLLGGVTDPLLTWETTALFNAGLDFGFFNNRLTGLVEYYNKESVDLIYAQPLPMSTGNTSITTNVGSVRNYGWEFTLNGRIFTGPDFSWSAGFNFSLDKNEITELTQESFITGTKRWEVGRSLYDFYIQEWAGVNPANGRGMWFRDVIGDDGEPTGERTLTETYAQATRYYQGSSLPDIIGGFNTDIKLGNFDFNALLNFSFGSQVYDSSYAGLMSGFSRPGYQQSPDLEGRWLNPGDITNIPLLLNSQNDHAGQSTRFLYDNDYVRLRAITLGYSINKDAIQRAGLDNVRLFLRGDNLFTWQSHKGIDPEQSLAGTTNSRSYILKTMSLGLNVQF